MNEMVSSSVRPDLISFQCDLFQRYINYLDASPKTVQTYTRALRQFAIWQAENGVVNPTRDDILNFREDLKKGHKPSTVQLYITAVRLFFQWTAQEGLYPNVAEHLKGAKIDKGHKKDYLTSRQVGIILDSIDRDSIKGKRDYAIMVLMFTGGLRTVEVVRADIGDITTAGDCAVLYLQGKGREEKTDYVKLIPQVEDALRQYLSTRPGADRSEPLFTSLSNHGKGCRLSTRSVSRLIKNIFIGAGYNSDRLTAHSTRHTAVTLALLEGKSLQQVQQFARHSNIATTQIYAHNLDRAKNNCEAAIAKAIFK